MFCTSSATDMLLVPTVAILKNQPYLSVTHLHQPAIPLCHTSPPTAIPLHHTPPPPPNSHTSPSHTTNKQPYLSITHHQPTAIPLHHTPPPTNSHTSPSHTTTNKQPYLSITHHQQPLSFTHLQQQTAKPLLHIPPSTNGQPSPSHMLNNKQPNLSFTHHYQQTAKSLHHTSSSTGIPLSHIFINKQPKVMKNKSSNSTPSKTVLSPCLSIRFTKMYD